MDTSTERSSIAISATWDPKKEEWVYPQCYYMARGKRTLKRKVLELIDKRAFMQQAIRTEPALRRLVEQAAMERCTVGYSVVNTYAHYHKTMLTLLSKHRNLHPYLEAIGTLFYQLLPAEDTDLYPHGIMPNGMYSPAKQKEYGRMYPEGKEPLSV